MPNSLQDFAKKVQEQMARVGYVPTVQQAPWTPKEPIAQQDKAALGVTEAPVGIDPSWDYKTAKLGPNNEPLPQGAISWTPQGEPFYGGDSALGNWFNGLQARLNAPVDHNQDYKFTETIATNAQAAGEAFSTGDYWGWIKNSALVVAGGAIAGVQDVGKAIGNLGEEGDPNLLQQIPRAASEIVGGGLAALQEGAQQLEQLRGGLQEAGQAAGLGDSFTSAWLKKTAQERGPQGYATWPETILYAIDPIGLAWDAVRGVAGLVTGQLDEFGEGYQTGRTLYSQVVDSTLKAEYKRRMDAGENKYLLAQEMQDPGAELVGQLFADPLILYGMVAKSVRNAGWVESATDYVAKGHPELMAKLGGEAATEADRISKIADIASDGVKAVSEIKAGKLDEINKIGFRSLTAPGIRHAMASTTGSFFKEIASVMKTSRPATYIDDTMEVARGLWMMGSGNASDFAEGLNIVTRYGIPTNVALSRAGLEFAAISREMLATQGDAVKFIESLTKSNSATGTIEAIAKGLKGANKDENLVRAEKIFNNLSDADKEAARLDNLLQSYVKKVDSFSEKFVPTMTQRIKAGEDVGLKGRAIAAFDKAAYSAPVRGLNNFFGVIYMGTSPGYAFRNMLNNAVTIFADRGAKSAGEYISSIVPGVPSQALNDLRNIGGGLVDMAAKEGIGAIGSLPGVESVGGIEKTFSNISTQWESKASLILYRDGVVDTMNKAVNAAMRDLLPAMKEGSINPDLMRRFVMDAHYNPDEAVRMYSEALKSGYVDMYENSRWITDVQTRHLDEYRWLQEYKQVMEAVPANDLEAKIAASRKFYKDNIEALAAQAAKEDPQFTKGLAEIGDHLPYQPRNSSLVNKNGKLANWASDQYWGDAIENGLQTAKQIDQSKPGAGIPPMLQPLFDKNKGYYALSREFGQSNIPDVYQLAYEEKWSWRMQEYDRVVKGGSLDKVKPGEFPFIAERLGIPKDVAAGVKSRKELTDAFWAENYTFKRDWFGKGREEYAQLANQFLDELNKLDPRLVDGRTVTRAIDATELARKWDDATLKAGKFFDAEGNVLEKVAYMGAGETPTFVRAQAEGIDGLKNLFDDLEKTLRETHGVNRPITGGMGTDAALEAFRKEMNTRMTEARFAASRVGKAYRDFALHDYGLRTNMDTALGLLYPYQFWYGRTYKNWFTRIVSDPFTATAYAKYKNYMSEVHAGLPDWWKYNVNSNELLGMKSDHPLFFNLEATLNPLNGLTGVDFNDPKKITGWWTATLDGLNKLGPSTWTPLSIATALALHLKGEDDAAARWGGRLIPQTATLESLANMAGLDPFNTDPAVALFSNGIDPYTRRRVGRALGAMVNEGSITQAQAIDAANSQTGDIWTQAWKRAVGERAAGQISSFFFGVGFKQRSISDMQIDQFYNDYNALWNLKNDLSPSEFRTRMSNLETQYNFMDTVLLANKDNAQRDAALAYNVLGRLPPGGSSMAQDVGLSSDLQSKFYDTKGDFSTWAESDKNRFMAAITDLSALLDTPADATRQEWTYVKGLYDQVNTALESRFGNGINDQINAFYATYANDQSVRPNDIVSQALDYKKQLVSSNPLLATYYGGIDGVAKYLQGFMWKEIENTLGKNFTARKSAGDTSSAENKKYYAILDKWNAEIDARIVKIASYLPEAKTATLRPDANVQTSSQQQFVQSLAPIYITETDVIAALGETGYNIVRDFLNGGAAIPYKVRNKLVDLADQNGMSYYELLNMLRQQ